MKKNILTLIFIALITSSCLSRIENRGYSFELADYKVKQGLTSKSEIIKHMGSPSFTSYIDNELYWVYFEEKVEKLLFFKPKILERNMLLITFDKGNIVKEASHYDLSNENLIEFNPEHTQVKEVKKGFFTELFGNIGQVAPQN